MREEEGFLTPEGSTGAQVPCQYRTRTLQLCITPYCTYAGDSGHSQEHIRNRKEKYDSNKLYALRNNKQQPS